ncbi:MAG: pilin [Candidatus Pacebacteria bacterium]|nr:pilin [Candidatus Paceibacterota bacterium]MCF7862993.1 pilin [Candidatus Paceibacterota bacterium]
MPSTTYEGFLNNLITQIINPAIVLMFALATVIFLFGVFKFISKADQEEGRTDGKNSMLWGVLGMTIMIGVWFLLGVIIETFGIEDIKPETNTVHLKPFQ